MNILLINHYAGSPKHGMEYRPYYLAKEWIKRGHKVTIVAASFSHVRSKQPSITDGVTYEEIDGIRYVWLKTPAYRGNGIGRVFNIFSFIRRLSGLCKRFVEEFNPDVVIASSTYPLDIYPAHRIAKMANAKLIFEVHDLWPLSPMELGGMSPWHPFIMIMQRAENYAYGVADRVVSMLPKADSHMKEHGMAPHKFVYIPNGIAVEEWQNDTESLPNQHQDALDGLKQEGKFIVGYAGSHGLANALNQLIDAAYLIQEQQVSFVLVGQGQEKENLQKHTLNKGLHNAIFLPPVPKGSIPSLLVAMDVLYIGWRRQPLYRFGVSPNKLMDYMMAAKPVIHSIEAGNDIVSESGCGITAPPEEPEAIANAVMKMIAMTLEDRESMGMRGREYVLANHTYHVLAQKFLSIMEDRQ
jgi:glycosyltransferase involved in cell wall biosynthesis